MSFILWFLYFFVYGFVNPVEASIGACSVSMSPVTIDGGSSANLSITLTNNDEDGDQVHWVKFTAPWSDMTITSADGPSLGGVEIDSSGNFVVVRTTMSGGETGEFTVGVTAGNNGRSATNFEVAVSDSSDGTNPASCTGDTLVTVNANQSGILGISSVSVSVNDDSAVVSWNTAVTSVGRVDYGSTNSYGNYTSNTSSGTSHSTTVSGLDANTLYYFKITATDSSGNTAESTSSFRTALAGSTTTVTVTSTVISTVTSVQTKILTDKTPPVLSINKLEKEVWESPPVLSGTVSDDRGIAKVEYSLDGVNWSLVSIDGEAGDKKMNWEFVPLLSLDGTYNMSLRSTDVFGNKSISKKVKFVIDKLPPTVGGAIITSSGVLLEARSGVVQILEKTPVKVLLKEVGGAEKLSVVINGKEYFATKDLGANIWSLTLVLDSGKNESKIVAIDGAGTKTERRWVTFEVLSNGELILNGSRQEDVQVNIWRKNLYGRFVKYATKKGFGWIVPPGEYYLVTKINQHKYVSQVISFASAGVLSGRWDLGSEKWWTRIVPGGRSIDLNSSMVSNENTQVSLDGLLPRDWYGSDKIIYITSIDLPFASEGLALAREEARLTGKDLHIVGLQHSQTEMDVWMKGKSEKYIADWEGKWLSGGRLNVLPARYYLDSFGKTVNIKEGIY